MPLRIEIPDQKLEFLTDEAKEELKKSVTNFSDGILKEAGRIEVSIRNDSNSRPEITRHLVQEAVTYQKSIFRKNSASKKYRITQLVSALSLFFSGIMFDFEEFQKNSTLLIFFFILASIAVLSTFYLFLGREE
ncbi:hypothetical protein MHB43_08040 [Paenibacillus sp. FSL H8-0317]|uniref:hypothetical protein n=1 Tax=Paenibacillus sp. FSL H8-0317 TaxID=2921385 RepID=UPI0032523FAA